MCVIFFLNFAGLSTASLLVPRLTNDDPQMYFFYNRLFGQFFILAGAINAPVLYFCR
jgi:hypothetical protein